MKQAVTRELYAYWNQLRGGRAAPERSDIDPAAIRRILSDTFIIEVDRWEEQPRFPFRLSGTRLNAFFLTELKGLSLVEMWDSRERAALLRILHSVLDDCAPVVAGLVAAPGGHPDIDFEMLLLPLRHHGRTHSRILGSIAPIKVPPWLGLLAIEYFTLSSLRLIDQTADSGLSGPPDDSLNRQVDGADRPKRYGNLIVHQGGR